jgi:small subunit ribosomal protein S4
MAMTAWPTSSATPTDTGPAAPVDPLVAGGTGRRKSGLAPPGQHAGGMPAYLQVGMEALTARLLRLPRREEIPVICDERLVVEFYSR